MLVLFVVRLLALIAIALLAAVHPVVPAAHPAAPTTAAASRFAPNAGPVWECIVAHESGGNPRAVNPRSGASGLVQFMPATWHAMGMTGEASDYPPSVQMAVAYRLQARAGWAPWRGDGCV